MVAGYIAALIAIIATFTVLLSLGARFYGKSFAEQGNNQQFQARLIKRLPPDVQTDINSGQLRRVIALAVAIIVLPSIAAILLATVKPLSELFVAYMLLVAVAGAVWFAVLAKTWLDRRNPGAALADLSPHPVAGAVRRSAWLNIAAVALCFSVAVFPIKGVGQWLFLAVGVAVLLVMVMANLMSNDRVWLTANGLYVCGGFYQRDRLERLAWTDDGSAFALRTTSRWSLQRWIVVPVPAGSREATEEALRQVLPTPTPTS